VRRYLDVSALRAAWWALRALRHARQALPNRPVTDVRIDSPPSLPPAAARGVRAVLRRRHATCLERSLVLQAWEAAHDAPRAVVIGVSGSSRELAAHAWLEGEVDGETSAYQELFRVPAR
jgi:Transglutaminase-like superfamily